MQKYERLRYRGFVQMKCSECCRRGAFLCRAMIFGCFVLPGVAFQMRSFGASSVPHVAAQSSIQRQVAISHALAQVQTTSAPPASFHLTSLKPRTLNRYFDLNHSALECHILMLSTDVLRDLFCRFRTAVVGDLPQAACLEDWKARTNFDHDSPCCPWSILHNHG